MTYFDFAVLVGVIVLLLSLVGVIYGTANHTGPFDAIVFRIAFTAFLIPIGVWTFGASTKGTNCRYVEEEKTTYETMVKSKNVEYVERYLKRKGLCEYGFDVDKDLLDAYAKSQTKNILNDTETK